MPGVEENREVWTTRWDWSSEGDEWSRWWGSTEAMWFGALLPRIHAFVPTGTILEIGPGYGRWTQYLKDLAERLVLVDLAENCIDHCRGRFAGSPGLEFHVNDGRSLDMVDDHSVDLAFSFDSLVHADADAIAAYVAQLARKLTPDGVGVVHHSNLGAYRRVRTLTARVPPRVLAPLIRRGALIDVFAWRASDMTLDRFASLCEDDGLACVGQERISWESGRYLIDAISVFTPRGSKWERPLVRTSSPRLRSEARRMATLYASTSFPGAGRGPAR